jgi:hypothetical protein
MTATMEQIREAIADSLKVIDGLQASAYPLTNPTLPSACVLRGPLEYDQSFAGDHTLHTLTVKVRVYVADLLDIAASKNLDDYIAPAGVSSIKAAVEADTSLGGLISDLHVTGTNGEQQYVRASGGALLGSEWNIDLWL